jgi:hypothetical protein
MTWAAMAFIEVCARLARNMYTTSEGDNLAGKLEPDLILITPTRVNKNDLQVDDVAFINHAGRWWRANIVRQEKHRIALQVGKIKELDRQVVIGLGNVMKARNLPLVGAPGVNQSLEALYFDAKL